MRAPSPSTPASLLFRLRTAEPDARAWRDFVEAYGPLLLAWCRKWRLQEADAEDVTQGILIRLAQKMRTFEYDAQKSFRAYLRTVARYALVDYLQDRSLAGTGDTQALLGLHQVAAREDLEQRLSAQFDHEILQLAAERVRARVEPHTWEAFRLTTLEGLSGAAAAQRLGIKIATVFKAKSKVQRMLKEEIARLEGDAVDNEQGPDELSGSA